MTWGPLKQPGRLKVKPEVFGQALPNSVLQRPQAAGGAHWPTLGVPRGLLDDAACINDD